MTFAVPALAGTMRFPGFQGPDHADSQPQDELQEGPDGDRFISWE